jgi:hypothetical protein
MDITLNVTPATPADFAAFEAEYAEWNKAVEASIPAEQPREDEDNIVERDLCDMVREHEESKCDPDDDYDGDRSPKDYGDPDGYDDTFQEYIDEQGDSYTPEDDEQAGLILIDGDRCEYIDPSRFDDWDD